MNQIQQALTYIVVLLTDMMLQGDAVHEGTMLEVEKAVRDDWRGSRLARDATDQEVEQYRLEQGTVELISDDIDELARQRGDLEDEIAVLEQSKGQLSGELEQLTGKHETLTAEVAALEAKAKAAKAGAK
jgi:chromosome segregation ATPase